MAQNALKAFGTSSSTRLSVETFTSFFQRNHDRISRIKSATLVKIFAYGNTRLLGNFGGHKPNSFLNTIDDSDEYLSGWINCYQIWKFVPAKDERG